MIPSASSRRRAARALLAALLLATGGVQAAGLSGDEAGFDPDASRTSVRAERQMVASANPIASEAGLAVLRRGGSAVDALVAMQLVLTVVEPQSSGIGGSGYAVHFDKASGTVAALDGRVAFPKATTDGWFQAPGGQWYGDKELENAGRSVGVPGVLRLLEALHEKHGKLPWETLVEPALQLAEGGFEMSPRLHASIQGDRFLKRSGAAAAHFLDRHGRPKRVGTRLVNPDLAASLRLIAESGAKALYEGPLAARIAAAVRGAHHLPAPMTADDLSAYRVGERKPVCVPYRVWRLCSIGASASGGTVLQMMKLVERFDLARLDPNSAEAVHLMVEASKLARADRALYMADPDFVPDRTTDLLDPGYVAERSALIDPARARGRARSGKPPGDGAWNLAPSILDETHPATTQLCAVDAQGNAVTMTSSVGGNFGSRIMAGGFMLNNQLDASRGNIRSRGRLRVNRPEPGKRSRSTMAPVLVFDRRGGLVLAVGSPGGGTIEDYVFKTLLGVLDWSLDIQAAINLPNRSVIGVTVELERGTALTALAPRLKAMGHKVRIKKLTSGIQGIAAKNGALWGGADPRREGTALGD